MPEPVTLDRLRSPLADVQSDRLLDLQETALYLEVQPDELEGWVDENLIPHELVAGQPIFRLREIVRWEVEGQLRLRASEGAER
ncbi:MAG: hypothetical protein ABIP48_14220 [Planctomycetota bacterium]